MSHMERIGAAWETLRWSTKYLRPYRRLLLPVSAVIVLTSLLSLSAPLLVKDFIDALQAPPVAARELLLIGSYLVAVHAVITLLQILQGRLAVPLASNLSHDIRTDVYETVQRLTMREHDRSQVGSRLSHLINTTLNIQFFLQDLAIGLLPNLALLFGVSCALLVLNPCLMLVLFSPAPFVAYFAWVYFKRRRSMVVSTFANLARMLSHVTDSLSGLRDVKSLGSESREIASFRTNSRTLADSIIETDLHGTAFFPTVRLLFIGSFVTALLLGGLSVAGLVVLPFGEVTIGTVVGFMAYGTLLSGPLHALAQIGGRTNQALVAASKLREVMTAEQETEKPEGAVELEKCMGHIEFRGVHFSYRADANVLNGISFQVSPGEVVGLTGSSGAGKTTIANLLMRFYQPSLGEILIDGIDVRLLPLRTLRRHVGAVLQHPYLFDGSVAENIALAVPGASTDEVIEAAKAANAHDQIMTLPDQYDTIVGEGGKLLSGGQRQLIALARVILKNPAILILDEATSAVDSATEKLLQSALRQFMEGRTTVVIAHRLSTLRKAHRLLVVENGIISESGTHDQLQARGGYYATLLEDDPAIRRFQERGA